MGLSIDLLKQIKLPYNCFSPMVNYNSNDINPKVNLGLTFSNTSGYYKGEPYGWGSFYEILKLAILDVNSKNSKLGWWNITDNTFTNEAPQVILANTRTKLSINCDSTIDNYSPLDTDINSIWDKTNEKITPLNIGDSYIFRLSLTANPTLNNRNFTIDLDIGGNQNIIFERTSRLARGAGNETKISITNSIFVLDTFFQNGGELYVTCDGDVNLSDISLFIQKVTSA